MTAKKRVGVNGQPKTDLKCKDETAFIIRIYQNFVFNEDVNIKHISEVVVNRVCRHGVFFHAFSRSRFANSKTETQL